MQCVFHLDEFLKESEKDFDKAAEDLRLATKTPWYVSWKS